MNFTFLGSGFGVLILILILIPFQWGKGEAGD